METSETTGAIAAALAKAHLEIENPDLDGVNPHFKSRFSTLAAVLNAVRKPLAKQGIALMQSVSITDGRVAVTTSMIHASGEWMRETMAFPIQGGANVQQAGSTVTYLRRYSLISLCAIVGDPHEDDDGDRDRAEREDRKPAPARRPPFKPDAAKGAPPAPPATKVEVPASPPAAGVDSYPDEYEGDFKILRVTSRPGHPHALQAVGQHGQAWIATSVGEFAEMARAASIKKSAMRLHVERVGNRLEIMRVIAAAPAAEEVLP